MNHYYLWNAILEMTRQITRSLKVHIIFTVDPGKTVMFVPSGGDVIWPKQHTNSEDENNATDYVRDNECFFLQLVPFGVLFNVNDKKLNVQPLNGSLS